MRDMRSLEEQGILDSSFVDKMQESIDNSKGQEYKDVWAITDYLQEVRSEEEKFRADKSPPHTRKKTPTRRGIKKRRKAGKLARRAQRC